MSSTPNASACAQPLRTQFGIHRARCSQSAVPRERAQIPGTGQASSAQAVGSNTMKTIQLSLLILMMAGVLTSATSQQQDPQSREPVQLVQARAGLAAAEAAHPGNTPEVANALILLSQRQRVARRNIDEAVALAKRAVAVSEAAKGRQSALYATALAEMAKVYLA